MTKLYNINFGDIKTGDVIKITGAYAKNDNGYFVVEHSPEDCCWIGSDYSLRKLNKNGTYSKAKYNICFLPIVSYSNNKEYCALSKEHNEKNVNIEIVKDFNMENIVAHFEKERDSALSAYDKYCCYYGEDCETTKNEMERAEHYKNVLEYINRKEVQKIESRANKTAEPTSEVSYTIEESTHTKTGEKIYIVKPTETLDRDTFNAERARMKENGGYYSRFTHSFVFSEYPEFLAESEEEQEETAELPEVEEVAEETDTLKEGDKIKIYIFDNAGEEITDCCNYNQVYEIEKVENALCFKYGANQYYHFSVLTGNVVYENIENGKKYRWDGYKMELEPIQEESQPTPPEPTKTEKSAEVETATAEIKPNYYPINEQTARTAQELNSFYDYTAGSATATYKEEVDEVYRIVEEIAEKRPEQAEKAVNMANRYSKKLADYYNAYYRNEASCPSIMICGAGNFPTRKKEKQNSRRDSLMKEWKYLQEYKRKIENLLTCQNVIKSGDADAIEQLKAKIEKLEANQEFYKASNKAVRMKDTAKGNAELEKLGYTAEQIEELRKPDFCGRVGFASYVLTNNNANIKRLKARLASLEKAKATETTEETATGADGCELFQIVRNTEIMRLQLVFDGKPDAETRSVLKSNGFKWAPSAGVWQRLLNNNAEYALDRIKKELTA